MSPKIKIIPYHKRYLRGFIYTGVERSYYSSDEEVREVIKQKASLPGTPVIGVMEGEVVFFAGIYILSSRVGEAWLYLNIPSEELKKEACEAIRGIMYKVAGEMDLVRLQSICLPFQANIKFLERLGFKFEAVLHLYYEGIMDVLIYTILWRS